MTTANTTFEDDLLDDLEDEIHGDINIPDSLGPLVVSSRDWTVETVVRQIAQGNIDLNPKFQRRNAWNDGKRSGLIESLIWGVPVPEIVLAENPEKPRAYLVIDGKQRLLTLAGFFDPDIEYWKKPSLSGLKVFSELNGCSASALSEQPELAEYHRRLTNADIRCTVLSNYQNVDVLYEIFYRINTGSVRLGSQELRQVLHRGWFADFLIEKTNDLQLIHEVLNLDAPDVRLADVEVILRSIAIELFGKNYQGNLKQFLDSAMETINNEYGPDDIENIYTGFNKGISNLQLVFNTSEIGRKITHNIFESRFNRALFEVRTISSKIFHRRS